MAHHCVAAVGLLASLNATTPAVLEGGLAIEQQRRLEGGRGGFMGVMRRAKGKGKGRGTAGSASASQGPALPESQTPPNERVCFPLPPEESRPKQGQVLEGTSFGAALSAIASLPEVKRVLELGTWYGGGSTVNLVKGVRDSARSTLARSLGASAPSDNCVEQMGASGMERCCHSLVVTVEVFEPAWEHARRYLREWPVWCVRGSTVAAEEMLQVRAERHVHAQRRHAASERARPLLSVPAPAGTWRWSGACAVGWSAAWTHGPRGAAAPSAAAPGAVAPGAAARTSAQQPRAVLALCAARRSTRSRSACVTRTFGSTTSATST
jgi:hypothetical protein